MADLPIPFSAPMICALLDARKTMTRRLLTRLGGKGGISEFGLSTTCGYDWHFRDKGARWHDLSNARVLELLPWRVNDRLWVREAWRAAPQFDDRKPSEIAPGNYLHYEADRHRADLGRYRHARFMPRWASRLTLIVEAVKVERLQDISYEDALAEGVSDFAAFCEDISPEKRNSMGETAEGTARRLRWPQRAFEALWLRLHGPEAWTANPWVVAISFRVIGSNIDTLGALAGPSSGDEGTL